MVAQPRGANGKFAKSESSDDIGSSGEPEQYENGAGSDTGGVAIVNPADLGGNESGESGSDGKRKKRGRPPRDKGQQAPGKKSETLALDSLNALLYSVHMLLATAVNTPEIALSETESKTLAQAASQVARHYDLTASQKAMDWGNLMIALGVVYIPRMSAIASKRKKKDDKKDDSFPAPGYVNG